ncbi:MAG: diphthamide biosynthesis enzyme Dph2 [Candidatus Hodarchaeales archaeon]
MTSIHYDSGTLEKILSKLSHGSRILMQFPEGLCGSFISNSGLKDLVDSLSNTHEFFFSGDPCYGFCDLPVFPAREINADLIVHFGHNDFGFPPPDGLSVIFFPVDYILDISRFLDTLANQVKWKTIGLISTVQHLKQLDEWKDYLESKGFKVIIPGTGQILGCNVSNPLTVSGEVDGYLLIAGGDFHAKQIPIKSGKPCLRLDPFSGDFKLFNSATASLYYRKRYAIIEKVKDARNIGLLVSLKSGQYRFNYIELYLKKIKKTSPRFKIYSFPVSQIIPEFMDNFTWIDAWVIDRCPRIATDDTIRFIKPVLTFDELEVVTGSKSWESIIPEGLK